ncbi:CDP-alcohol phosphatidyltransferase family protein [Rhodopirellula bahusiensis]|uniref:Phosphatidylcholine synthase n=1 Tax=Rhodopirellula bahusiensis TaxID=2014065 RepID=A0A2G1W1K1_9BACT|nr:CDP-alcohol phosphatidyltransferase family protein [Rhodopirellula bahusiensis]PHQ32902.1 phosphatidylcholine synthase [Rhodopirellula bahusiensis]
MADTRDQPTTTKQTVAAYAVHALTASGILPAALAMLEITRADCDPRRVFGWLLLTTFIDAIDGPLARRYHVKTRAKSIDGRTIDDLLDYLTFAFIPLMLVWRMNWMPDGFGVIVALAMGASLFGFAHSDAKDEQNGFFRGFPSYWNIAAFYAGLLHHWSGQWPVAVIIAVLAGLTIAPIRLVYPNLAPEQHRVWLLSGAAIWTLMLIAMLPMYPQPPAWLVLVSLVYPILYTLASFVLWRNRPFQPRGPVISDTPSR